MTKKKFSVAVLFLVMCVMFLFVACNNEEKKSAVYEVTLSSNTITLDRYESATLTATVKADGVETDLDVTWTSDKTNVVTVSDGVLTAKGEGTAVVTATYKDVKAECAVTVADTGMRPILVLSEEKVELVIGGNGLTVSSYVSYKNQQVSDATITYKIGDPAIAEVDTAGNVVPKAYGNTDLTVSAVWHDVDAEFLTETIPVSVTEDVIFDLTAAGSEIYTYAGTVGDIEFSNSMQMNCSATIGGVAIDSKDITWESSDPAVLTVNDSGVVSSVSEGEAYVVASYNSGKQVYTSAPYAIKVLFPVVDKTDEISIDFDTSLATLTIDGSQIFETEKDVVNVIDEANAEESIYSDGSFIKDKMTIGERTFIVYNDEWAYKISAVVVTKILRTEEDLKNIQTLGGVQKVDKVVADVQLSYYPYSGYFILGNNIEATVSVDYDHVYGALSSEHNGYRSTSQDGMGFTGVFDGRGYTISGFCFKAGGLLGDISNDAIVKNVGFSNIQLHGSQAAALAFSVRKAKLSNLFFDVTNEGSNQTYGNAVVLRYAEALNMKNVVVIGAIQGTVSNVSPCNFVANPLDIPVELENVYVFYKDGMLSSLGTDATASNKFGLTAVALSAADGVKFEDLGEYFTTSENGIPVMKSMTISSVSEIEVNNGSTFNVSDYVSSSYFTVETGSLPSGVTYEDGVFTVGANAAEGSFTFKVISSLNTSIYKDITVDISVLPVDIVTVEDHFEVDLSEKGALLLDLPDGHGFTDGATVLVGDKDISASATLQENKLAIDYTALDAGKTEIVVNTATKKITYTDVEIITKILRTEEDLKNIQTLGGVQEKEYDYGGTVGILKYYPYSGYFVLGNNIEATVSVDKDNAYGAKSSGHNGFRSTKQERMGFTGVFDGRGYTISGFCFTIGGLLGDLSDGAVVKNVGFSNIQLHGSQASALAFSVRKAQLSNLFFDVSNEDTDQTYGHAVVLRYAEALNMKNVVVIGAIQGPVSKNVSPCNFVGNPLDIPPVLENVYVFYKDGMLSILGTDATASNKFGLTAVALSAADGEEFADLGEYFTTSENGIPVMKTMPVADTEVTMTKGSTYNVSDCVDTNYYTVEATELPAGVTYEGGVFTLTGEATGTFTFKVVSSFNTDVFCEVSVTIA